MYKHVNKNNNFVFSTNKYKVDKGRYKEQTEKNGILLIMSNKHGPTKMIIYVNKKNIFFFVLRLQMPYKTMFQTIHNRLTEDINLT